MKRLIFFALIFGVISCVNKNDTIPQNKSIRNKFSPYLCISKIADEVFLQEPSYSWKELNNAFKKTDFYGVDSERDVERILIIRRGSIGTRYTTTLAPDRIFYKEYNMMFFFDYSSNDIKTNNVFNLEEYKKHTEIIQQEIKSSKNNIDYANFKKAMVQKNLFGRNDIFILTNSQVDSLEFYIINQHKTKVIRWYLEGILAFQIQYIKDSTSIQ